MAAISYEKKSLFLANPGTGSTTVQSVLINKYGWIAIGGKHDDYEMIMNDKKPPWLACLSSLRSETLMISLSPSTTASGALGQTKCNPTLISLDTPLQLCKKKNKNRTLR